MRIGKDHYCGNPAQLQTQNEKMSNLTPKRLKGDFFLFFVKRLKSDQKVTFWAPKVTFESL